MVAPFISLLTSLALGQPTALRYCDICDFRFFDSRYGSEELSSIYERYRSDQYRAVRQHWEPWYSQSVNDSSYADTGLVSERRSFMMRILKAAQMDSKLDCAVDFGGDEGQFFPPVPTGRRIVCDVSQRDLPDGIEHISTMNELGDVKPDLVIVAHVLEHLPDPVQPLTEIRRSIAENGILYVEVPLDSFGVTPFHASARYQRYLRRLIPHRYVLIMVDFLSGVSRQFRSSIPTLGLIKQSEHINYFSVRSVLAALTASGFTVVAQYSEGPRRSRRLSFGRYGVAARPNMAWEDDPR